MLKNLSKFAAKIKHSIDIMKIYLNKKCQVRCENATRWGSSFLMLASFINAYDKGAFLLKIHKRVTFQIELFVKMKFQ